MDVFELGGSFNSVPFWHGNHDYRRLDLDPPLTLQATANGFEIRTSVGASGGDRISRKGVMRYAVAANSIHRVEPIAMNAHDSVEEWLEMPPTEAAEFADEPDGSLTWTMFGQFSFRDKQFDPSAPYQRVGAVRACSGDPKHFQAEVNSETLDTNKPGPAYFVQLRQVPHGYRIHAVTRTQDPSCNGTDLMSLP